MSKRMAEAGTAEVVVGTVEAADIGAVAEAVEISAEANTSVVAVADILQGPGQAVGAHGSTRGADRAADIRALST
jgi:hypothetical protein